MAEGGHRVTTSTLTSHWRRRLDQVGSQLTMTELLRIMTDICQMPERRRERILRNANPAAALFEELDRNDELLSDDEELLNDWLAKVGRSDLIAELTARRRSANTRTSSTAIPNTPFQTFESAETSIQNGMDQEAFPNRRLDQFATQSLIPSHFTEPFRDVNYPNLGSLTSNPTPSTDPLQLPVQQTNIAVPSQVDDDPELTFAIDFICDNVGDQADWTNICRELDFTGRDFDRASGIHDPFRHFLNIWRSRTPSPNPRQQRAAPSSLTAPLCQRVETLIQALKECNKKATAKKLRETIIRRRHANDNEQTLPKRL